MSTLERLQNTDISPKTAAISITALALVLTVIVWGVKTHLSSSTSPVTETASTRITQPVKVDVKESTVAAKKANEVTTPEDKLDDSLKVIAERNIFKPIPQSVPGSDSNRPAVGRNLPGRQIPPMSLGMLPPMPVGPGSMANFGGRRGSGGNRKLAYTGIVRTPDGTFALIENTSTGETKYAREGDRVFGAEVVLVDDRSTSLEMDGQMLRLGIGENKTSEPAAQPAAGVPGGVPPVAGINPPGMNAPPSTQSGSVRINFGRSGSSGFSRRGRSGGVSQMPQGRG